MNPIFLIIFSYILGSIPFGFIFTKIFTGKNILEIGWRKTSGSNVFKNVGVLPGLLTGIFDLGKGFFSIWLAKKIGAPIKIQALCGVFAVLGHNWSIFLKFAGGRGIGTLVGAFLVLAPKILFFSLLPTLILVLLWDTSIATIFFLFLTIFLSFKGGVLETVGLLPLCSLFPIFLKRLSPIGEISLGKWEIIKNRLLYDDDVPHFEWRITRIIKKIKKGLLKKF